MKLNAHFLVISCLILLAIISRLLPHIPNFTAISAVALFGAAQYNKKFIAFLAPLTALFLSDAVLYFYPLWPGEHSFINIWIYLTFVLIILLGFMLRNKVTASRVILLSVVSSLIMFVVSDFGVWLNSSMYPHTWAGFYTCYVAAVPFLRNELLGDLLYSGLLFGAFYLAQVKFPTLLKQRIQ